MVRTTINSMERPVLMEKQVRIAARQAATELTNEEIGMVSGGMMAGGGTIMNDHESGTCRLDTMTDCWVTGGDFVANDDAN